MERVKKAFLADRGWKNLIILLTIMTIVLFCTGCSDEKNPASSQPAESNSQSEIFGEEPKEPEGQEIKTPVGSVFYPNEFSEYLHINTMDDSDMFVAEFCAELEKENVVLFILHMGEKESGYCLGTVPDTAGNPCTIWLDVPEIEGSEAWSEEEKGRVADMQARVNDILDQIYHLEGFQAAEAAA